MKHALASTFLAFCNAMLADYFFNKGDIVTASFCGVAAAALGIIALACLFASAHQQ